MRRRSGIVIEKVIQQSEIRSIGHSMRLDALAYTSEEGIMGYGGDIDGYINEVRRSRMNKGLQDGMKNGMEDAIKLMLKKKISSLSEIADAFDMPPLR